MDFTQRQIERKLNYNAPYYATFQTTDKVITDMDHFPYKRFFRGIYNQNNPTVMEREAGFRPRNDSCYTLHHITVPNKPTYCWEYPCSTVKPCKGKEEESACVHNFVMPP